MVITSIKVERIKTQVVIPELGGIGRNCYQFPPISVLFNWGIPESDGIPRNCCGLSLYSIPESLEAIPGSELVPECSTLRNRMTAQIVSSETFPLLRY